MDCHHPLCPPCAASGLALVLSWVAWYVWAQQGLSHNSEVLLVAGGSSGLEQAAGAEARQTGSREQGSHLGHVGARRRVEGRQEAGRAGTESHVQAAGQVCADCKECCQGCSKVLSTPLMLELAPSRAIFARDSVCSLL